MTAATFTLFPDQFAATMLPVEADLDYIATLVRSTARPSKAGLPWVKLAAFGDKPSARKCLRYDANVIAIMGVEGDYDAELVSIDEAGRRLAAVGIDCLLYETASSTPSRPRWRVLAPTAQTYRGDLLHELRQTFLARINGALGGILAPESFDISRAFYFGSIAGKPPVRVIRLHGAKIDSIEGLPEIYRAGRDRASAKAVAAPVDEPATDPASAYVEGARAYLATLARDGVDPGRWHIAAALVRNFGLTDATAIELWEASGLRIESHSSGNTLKDKIDHARIYGSGRLGDGVAHDTWRETQADGATAAGTFGHLSEIAADAASDDAKWRNKLTRSKNHKALDLAKNARLFLAHHPAFAGRLSYNEFARRPLVSGALPWNPSATVRRWDDADDRALACWLQDHGCLITKRTAADAVDLVARERSFHPVRDYLAGLQWDGRSRLATMLAGYFGADQEPPEYLAAVGTRWAISAIARIFDPGCQADHALIFEGIHQGEGKSTALRTLAVHDDWFADQLPDDLASRSASLCLDGKWIIELSELSSMRRSDIEPVKAFISRRVEHYDPKFSNRTVDIPRQCVFAGSTNEAEYLRDVTGNRRFWPVRCGARLDIAGLARDRDQLWAEAVARYRNGEHWWLDPAAEPELAGTAEAVQRSRLVTTSRDDALDDYLNGRHPVQPKPLASATLAEVFVQLYGLSGLRDRDPRIEQEIARRLVALGWERRWVGPKSGPREKRYFRPQRGPYRRAIR